MKKSLVLALIAIGLTTLQGCDRQPADLILTNGKVFTGNEAEPWAEAIAITDDGIVAVGSSWQIERLTGTGTRTIDLHGHVIIPGINDAHYHHTPDPRGHRLAFQSMDPTWSRTRDAVAGAATDLPEGEWILGTVGLSVVSDSEATRFELDRVAPDHPVFLRAFYGHGYILNTRGMEVLGVADDEPDPIGGFFERASGSDRVNGKFFEYAQYGPSRMFAESASDEEIVESMRALADDAIRFGITSIQNMSFLPVERYVRLLEKARLPIRIRAIRFPPTTPESRLDEGRALSASPPGSLRVRVSGTKWILDGTPLERLAAWRTPYRDRPDWYGRLNFPEEEIAAMVSESLERDDQLLVHAAGDRPAAALFDAMESLGSDSTWKASRVRIEHGDGVVGDLILRAASLGVVVVQNPSHFTFTDIVLQRYGLESGAFPLKSLLDAGVPLALGSDGPLNPYLNIMFAVMHPANPNEALSREQAVRAYTSGSAYAEFADDEKGTIEVGKLADLAVLSQDIFEVPLGELPTTRSILTFVSGEVVHDAGVLGQE
jgi:predicted amidohydrolase YtcJ